MDSSLPGVTKLLLAWGNGDRAAHDELMPLVYGELRRMAKRYMAGQSPGHTLQTTALIHEAYLKLDGQKDKRWQSRAHFFAAAARAMRHILVDHARSRQAARHGGGARQVSLDEAAAASPERPADLPALDEALHRLAALNRRLVRVVELRYFGGLSVEETAEVLEVSPVTVRRGWRLARAWLMCELRR